MKTLEELFIKKYQDLEKENKSLEESLELSYKREAELIQERDKYKNKLIELISRLKEDYRIKIERAASILSGETTHYISINGNWVWKNSQKEKYEYYKETFNLKEEGEKENECNIKTNS